MARGNIYYITKNKNQDVSFSEKNYYDKLEALGLDYVDDQSEEASEYPLEWLRNKLSDMGAEVTILRDCEFSSTDQDFTFSFRFNKLEQAQQEYFRPKLEQFKKEAEALTLFDVMQSAPALDRLLDDDGGDLIAFDNEECEVLVSEEDFVRRLKPGVTYYVYKRVILMH